MTTLVSSTQPAGKSSFRPPMRSKFGWNRPPVADSIRLRTYSRSRNARKTGVIAPSCTPRSPRKSDTLAMRDSSKRIVRIHCARGGASTPISFSAAKMNGTSLAKLPSQSIRLMSVVTCGYVRTSVNFSYPRCMYPADGSAHTTCSPSRRAMMRSVPCVAGCCGPMLRVIPSVSSSTLSRASAACAAM